MDRLAAVLVVSLLSLSGKPLAQDLASAELVNDPFVEIFQPEVAVSGSVIVGVMTAAAAHAVTVDSLVANGITPTDDNEVCLRVASSDGIYTSRNQYRVGRGTTGPVRLPYLSSRRDVIEDYVNGQIALAATAGACDSSDSIYYLLDAASGTDNTDVVIYLNSFGATDVFWQANGAQDEVHACEYVSEGRRTTYDYFCTLSRATLGHDTTVAIIRERFGREQPAIELRILGAQR